MPIVLKADVKGSVEQTAHNVSNEKPEGSHSLVKMMRMFGEEVGKSTFSANRVDNTVKVSEHFEFKCECPENNRDHDLSFDHDDTYKLEEFDPQLFAELIVENEGDLDAVMAIMIAKQLEAQLLAQLADLEASNEESETETEEEDNSLSSPTKVA